MTERTSCLCPGCRRTIATEKLGGHDEWICGKHWTAVPKYMRKRLAMIRRRLRKDHRWRRAEYLVWMACKKRAIDEAFMGVHP